MDALTSSRNNLSDPGTRFRQLVQSNSPLIIAGVINACAALLAKQAQLHAIYLSGAGVANADFGLPDLGITALPDVVEQVVKITSAVDLPLLVDGDTGWGGALNIAHAVQQLIKAGAAGVHFEDQAWPKRCGHRDGKKLISSDEMASKIAAAVEARDRYSAGFVIMARTDAIAVDGVDAAVARAQAYAASGADMIFAEAVATLPDYGKFVAALPNIPILANITEFGKTPLFTADELASVGVKMMLFPLSAFRAMNAAAFEVFNAIKSYGTQQQCLVKMQTREQLYALLDYETMEFKT